MTPTPYLPLAAGLLLLLLAAVLPAQAHDGHEQDAAPATIAAAEALPRLVASSELFELVGVLKGKQLTLYLDHAASNAPVQAAKLELDWGGRKLQAKPQGTGEFELMLDQAPKAGLMPVTAIISTASDSDLLAGELDIHADAEAHEAAGHALGWGARGAAAAGLAALLLAGLALLRRSRRRALSKGAAA